MNKLPKPVDSLVPLHAPSDSNYPTYSAMSSKYEEGPNTAEVIKKTVAGALVVVPLKAKELDIHCQLQVQALLSHREVS